MTRTRWGCCSRPRGALSTFYPDAVQVKDADLRHIQIIRLLAKMPTLAAFSYRHNMGQPYVYPDNDLSYAGNFLSMMYKMTELKYEPDPRVERALDVLFILHADHEQNASTSSVRAVGSTQVDPVLGGRGRRRGALRPAARRRQRAGAADAQPRRLGREHPGLPRGREARRRAPHGLRPPRLQELRPARPRSSRSTSTRSSRSWARSPLLDIAVELEKRALDDDYFTSRKLYPNVDFYSGLLYEALRLPTEMFPVMFAIGRALGLDRPVAGDDPGLRAEDRAPAPDLHGRPRADVRPRRPAVAS